MNKKVLSVALAGSLLLSAVGTGSVFASEKGDHEKPRFMDREQFEQTWSQLSEEEKEQRLLQKAADLNLDIEDLPLSEVIELLQGARETRIIDKAELFGVDTTDKSIDEIKVELLEVVQDLHETVTMEKAAELGIETEGKSIEEIREEIKEVIQSNIEEKIYEIAAKMNIDTEGKTVEEIRAEVEEICTQKVLDKAAELGIDTSGYDLEDHDSIDLIKEEIKEIYQDKHGDMLNR
ncbi:hypothetical protein [Chengkuizengella sediminis]|uniref:hypothetical protein n=1 Tax=Chengkuizengella sediminis TaxID=1885917 RepID=UPI0013899137|nr:hypothetical protein [Chengkuizengella sediminis]NDI34818.1 hypothetical protein [Chengkuizengella sediminis]